MFKILLTIFLSQLLSYNMQTNSQVLGWQASGEQVAGDEIIVSAPQRINPQNLGLEISAASALTIDVRSGKILFEKKPTSVRSVASITKLMTVLVFLDTQPDLEQEFSLTSADLTVGSKLNLLFGEKTSLKNILALALINSDNNATLALVRSTGLSSDEFVKKMNLKAQELNLTETVFNEPVGLSSENKSNVASVAKLLSQALANEIIADLLQQKSYTFKSLLNKNHTIKNTNLLLGAYVYSLGGKTGFTEEANYCFTGKFKLKNNAEVITVVLGSETNEKRFQDTKAMLHWVETNYQW